MSQGVFSGHPRGLYVCFSTELWERFSYYGMRALLIFYLTQHFLYSDDRSYAIYGTYTALAYLLPVVGGTVADRWLGPRKAVTLGAILLSIGHFGMAIEGPPALAAAGTGLVERSGIYLDIFYLSLSLIATGVGFLKTNCSTVVGTLYDRNDPRRDSGFTIFYMGINIGAFISPIICGWLGQTWGWRYGFGVAGIGMLAGLVGFLYGQKHLAGRAEPPDPGRLARRVFPGVTLETAIYAGAIVLVLLVWQLVEHQRAMGTLLGGFGAVMGGIIIWYSLRHCGPVERDRLLVVAVLIVFSAVFWSLYEQQGSSLALFSDRLVDRRVWGFEIPASTLQFLPPIYVIATAPLFTMLWLALADRGIEPRLPVKFGIGLILNGAAFFLPAIGAALAGPGSAIGLTWFALLFLFQVLGEMCLSPIALNMVTRLSPARIVGTMMGAYFLSLSAGNYAAGTLAQLTSLEASAGQAVDPLAAMSNYLSVFNRFGLAGIAAGGVLLLIAPGLYRRMHEAPGALSPDPRPASVP